MDFRKIIKDSLKRKGISVYKMCKDIDIATNNIYSFLNYKIGAKTSTLEKIFDYLDVTIG